MIGGEVSDVPQMDCVSNNITAQAALTTTTRTTEKSSKVLQKVQKDYKTFFATTLAKFEENPKPKMIPICGVTPRNVF